MPFCIKLLRLTLAFLIFSQASLPLAWADSPGGISANLQFWIKANAGLDEADGGNVDQWDDQSGNSRHPSQSTASNRPTFQDDAPHAANFNPVVNFDGSNDVLTTSFDIGVDQYSDLTVYSVQIPSTNVAGAPWGNDNGGWDRFIIDVGSINDAIATGTDGTPAERIEDVTGLLDAAVTLTTIQWDEDASNGSFGWVNGALGATFTADQGPQSDSNFAVGWDGDDNNFDGSVAEVAIYSSTHTALERSQIESYLAIKYGITLSATDYFNSSGSVIWDGNGTNSSFHNDVAGIGQDDDSGLDQIQSKSQNTGTIVTMKSATSQNNNDFLIWGNNGENQATWVSTSATAGYMYLGLTTSDRIEWRATETNNMGTVTIEVNESDLPSFEDPLYIVIDTDDDEDLTDETPLQMTDLGGGAWTYNHNFSNGATNAAGQEFTFAQETATPLNVCGSNLKLWLDADDPTTLHTDAACTSAAPTDGTNVKCWEDKSSNGDDVTEISGDCDETTSGTQTCGVPKYETNEFNGRPTLEFVRSEDDAMRHTLSSTWNSNFSLFIAFAQVGTPSTFYSFFSNGNPAGSDHFQIDSFDNSGTQTFRFNGAGGSGNPNFEPFDNDLKLYAVLGLSGGTTTYADGALKDTSDGTGGRIFEHYRVNQNRQGNHRNNAKISEIILCDTVLGTCDFSRMNKYLGDKYGRDFSGIDNQYDYTVNHGTDTAGIGFDTSGVTCTPAVVYDNTGSSILALRINSPYDTGHNLDLTNQDERLSVGHNNGALTETTSQVPSPYTHKLNRIWRADQDDGTGTDGIQDVVVSFDLSATSIDTSNIIDFALLLDADGNFSNATAHTTGVTITNDIVQFTGVDFTDGDYFTLATQGPDPGPGGVTSDIQLWLKADAGVTGTTNVSQWDDQSTSSNNIAQDASSEQPSKTDNAINFNPTIAFDGVDEYFDALTSFDPLVGDYSVFLVSKYSDKGASAVPLTTQVSGASINKTLIFVLPSGGPNMRVDHRQPADNSGGDSYTATNSFGQPLLLAIHRDGTSKYDGYNNGAETANSSPSEPAIVASEAAQLVVGRNTLGSTGAEYYFEGDIAEIAIYSEDKESDNGKIQSYLALKYGITLDQSGGGTDYIDSSGTEMWDKDAAGASTYDNDIAGIGQDTLSELDQRVSKSVNSDGIVTMATTNDFTSTNQTASRESLGHGNYLVWGNNNGAASWSTANSPNRFRALAREWSVQEIGSTGNLHVAVQVDDSDFDIPKFRGNLFFLYDSDNDGSLKDETPLEMVDAGSGRWTISNIDFSTGMEFTFAARARRRIRITD